MSGVSVIPTQSDAGEISVSCMAKPVIYDRLLDRRFDFPRVCNHADVLLFSCVML